MFAGQLMGLAFKKGSPLVEQFNEVILERITRMNQLFDLKLGQKYHEHFYPKEADVKVISYVTRTRATSGALVVWLLLILVGMLIALYVCASATIKCVCFMRWSKNNKILCESVNIFIKSLIEEA
jgi:hypothetical protein